MCVGIPMQVVSCDEQHAICVHQGQEETVDIRLVGEQPKGTWLLVFLGAAREVMDPVEAQQSLDAVLAMQKIMSGDLNIDGLFDDLVDREPELPPHLQALVGKTA